MKKNNLFTYATKELSQDAMLCWMINWINYPKSKLYKLGNTLMDLFMGSNKQNEYKKIVVKRQYKKIDILVLINDTYALIIEDKTNTSEHGEQINRYKELLCKEFPNYQIITSYIKTGIMYDEDVRVLQKVNTVISLNMLLDTLLPFYNINSEILRNYIEYLQNIQKARENIEKMIDNQLYNEALKTAYGQFLFLDRIFEKRSKGTFLGKIYTDESSPQIAYIDQIYAGANNNGTPWTQYCFWGEKYHDQLKALSKIEYHYLFWRIDCKWKNTKNDSEEDNWYPEYYIALRHYDENAHSKNELLNDRKRMAYRKFNNIAKEIYNSNTILYKKIRQCENYKESDLLFIPIENLKSLSFEEIKHLLNGITQKFKDEI